MYKIFDGLVVLLMICGGIIHLWTAYIGFADFGIITGVLVLMFPVFGEGFILFQYISDYGFFGHPFNIAIEVYVIAFIILFITGAIIGDKR
jgi:hypothetical protein